MGRTGTFIVIDSMLERIKHVDTVDIYGHVTCLRAQRNYMVQTEDQYVFIHDAVLEAITSGNTEILARNLSTHVRQLLEPLSLTEHHSAMQLEFQVHVYLFSYLYYLQEYARMQRPDFPKNLKIFPKILL